MLEQLADINHAGAEPISFPIMTERPKEFSVGGSQPFWRSGARLENTMSYPTIIHSNQATAIIVRREHSDWDISLGSMEIRSEL